MILEIPGTDDPVILGPEDFSIEESVNISENGERIVHQLRMAFISSHDIVLKVSVKKIDNFCETDEVEIQDGVAIILHDDIVFA